MNELQNCPLLWLEAEQVSSAKQIGLRDFMPLVDAQSMNLLNIEGAGLDVDSICCPEATPKTSHVKSQVCPENKQPLTLPLIRARKHGRGAVYGSCQVTSTQTSKKLSPDAEAQAGLGEA